VIDELQASWEETIIGHKILQLKGKTISRGLFPLEILFNSNDVATNTTEQAMEKQVEDYNIGSEKDHWIIKLENGVPRKYRKRYLDRFKNYMDVFSWCYDDLKTFDTTVIQYKIPLKGGVKQYKHKLK